MGQRLVVNVYKKASDEEPFCNIYFHWSAYSISCYQEIKRIYDAVKSLDAEDDEDVIKALMNVGIYPCSEEADYIKDNYGIEFDNNSLDRNNGLAAFSDKGMENSEGIAEGKGSVCLENGNCINDCFYCYDDKEEFMNEFKERSDEDIDIGEIKEFSCSPEEFNICDVDQLILEANETGNAYIGQYQGMIYELIC